MGISIPELILPFLKYLSTLICFMSCTWVVQWRNIDFSQIISAQCSPYLLYIDRSVIHWNCRWNSKDTRTASQENLNIPQEFRIPVEYDYFPLEFQWGIYRLSGVFFLVQSLTSSVASSKYLFLSHRFSNWKIKIIWKLINLQLQMWKIGWLVM